MQIFEKSNLSGKIILLMIFLPALFAHMTNTDGGNACERHDAGVVHMLHRISPSLGKKKAEEKISPAF